MLRSYISIVSSVICFALSLFIFVSALALIQFVKASVEKTDKLQSVGKLLRLWSLINALHNGYGGVF